MAFPRILAVRHFSRIHQLFLPEEHQKDLRHGEIQIMRLFKRAARRNIPRTLYIEGLPDLIEEMQTSSESLTHNPYLAAVKVAKRHGWKIVPLDRYSIDRVRSKGPRQLAEYIEEKPQGKMKIRGKNVKTYINNEVREKHWANCITNAESHDFVLIHPNHVEGLLQNLGASAGKKVNWIHQTDRLHVPRLTERKLKLLKRFRDMARAARRTGTSERKTDE